MTWALGNLERRKAHGKRREGQFRRWAPGRGSHTGGEVLLKSSEPAEWELEGVSGGIVMNCAYGCAPPKYCCWV